MAVTKTKVRGRVMWRARVIRNGVTRSAYRTRKDEALEAEQELLAELARPEAPVVPTLAEFAPRWVEYQATENKPGEIARKRDVLKRYLVPEFGDLKLDAITTAAVDGWKARLLQRLKPATVAGFITVLKRLLKVAERWEVIEKAPRVDQVRVPEEELDFLDFGEAEAFLAAAGSWRLFMLTAMRTGLRVGELRALRWSDVNVERKRIRVARSYTRAGMGTPKSGKARTVFLPRDLAAELGCVPPSKRKGFVFPTSNGTPLQYKTIYEACRRISRAAQLGRTIAPHGLRHTFGAHHAMRGTDLLRLRDWMGHADLRTTLRYSHLSDAARADGVDNIADPEV